MSDYFIVDVPEEQVRREREKARELRRSQWWKNRIARGVCHYCGGTFPPADLTMDHLVPLARGGHSSRGNVVPACKECNSRKKYLLPMEWDEYLEKMGRTSVDGDDTGRD
jgi:5-methylcytosine-specific restriction endonuclease McrA